MSSPSRPSNNYIGSSFILFFDQTLIAASNWIFWIVISKLASINEIGQSTTIYSLVLFTTTVAQLGLEYPLLKRATGSRTNLFLTVTIIELLITIALIPIIVYVLQNLYNESLGGFAWIAVGILIFSSLSFVARFSLLGVHSAKEVLYIDLLGTISKFGVGCFFVFLGFGTLGILMSFFAQFTIITIAAIPAMRNKLGFGLADMKYVKEILKDALTNSPSKFSRNLVFSLGVVLLALFGVSSSDVGVFYICLMISIVAGSLASSIAYMVLPSSSDYKRELSTVSTRMALSLTAPLIAGLITAPSYILTVIGKQYSTGDLTLFILSIGIFPSSLVMLSISHFNNLNESKKIIFVGILQIFSFLAAFYALVPSFGMNGGACAMLIAFVVSCIPAIVWSEKSTLKYIANSALAVVVSSAIGAALNYLVHVNPGVCTAFSVLICVMLIFLFKNLNTQEIRVLIRGVVKK